MTSAPLFEAPDNDHVLLAHHIRERPRLEFASAEQPARSLPPEPARH